MPRPLLVLALALVACAAGSRPQHTAVPTIPARPDDVGSIDGIMRAFYEVVNVEPDAPRQWSRDRTLYLPDIRFVAIGKELHVWDHQQFVDESEPLMRAGFYENEINRVERRYGNIAHVFSTYETRTTKDGPVRSRGVNSLQLFFDGKRWWVASVTWQSEDADHPIPPELLP